MLRGNSGLMYDQPINAIYEQAIVNDGTPARASFSLQATQAGAPAFPNVLTSGNAAANNPWIVDRDFQIARMWQNNLQLERGIGRYYSASVGVAYTRGDNLPVAGKAMVQGGGVAGPPTPVDRACSSVVRAADS